MKSGIKNYPTSLSTPIDSTAARVVGKGVQFQYDLTNYVGDVWDTPPPTTQFIPTGHQARDITGERHGKLVIVGYLGRGGSKQSKWLARCDCGLYVSRNGGTWRKARPDQQPDCCIRCARAIERKRNYDQTKQFQLTGKWSHEK